MILATTLNAELARLEMEIRRTARQRFAALSRSDAARASRFYKQQQKLREQRNFLIHGKPLFPNPHE
jgi:outer membrane murein-binding lipoprotein Lpp